MALRFKAQDQPFTFVDPKSLLAVSAEDLVPGAKYDVFVTVENYDPFEHVGVQLWVSHSAFGIGLNGGTNGLTQPTPIIVPPREFGIPGIALASFTFEIPTVGFGCLRARLSTDGPSIGLNQTVIQMPKGIDSLASFIVFGGTTLQEMNLRVEEFDSAGNPLHTESANSWNPRLMAPAGVPSSQPKKGSLGLTLPTNTFYSIGLQLCIGNDQSELHAFKVMASRGGMPVGEVMFKVHPVERDSFIDPEPYVVGGYQSPDILLSDPVGTLILHGGSPSGTTLLQPDSDYKLSAVVHNDSASDAVNTVVRFWEIPFGTALEGYLLDLRTVNVPAGSSILVTSNFPFRSALPGMHSCAAVSIYNSQSLTATVDPVCTSEIPWTQAGGQCPTAWRNTDSMLVFRGKPWRLSLAVSNLDLTDGVNIQASAAKIPVAIEAPNDTDLFEPLAVGNQYPNYLLTEHQLTLPKADLNLKVQTATNGTYTIEGEIPTDAQPGDKYLVTVNATYPDRTVQFFETLYVGHEPVLKG